MRRACAALTMLLLASAARSQPAPAPAPVIREKAREVVSGVRVVSGESGSAPKVAVGQYLAIDTGNGNSISLRAELPPDGLWSAAPLGARISAAKAPCGFALWQPPGPEESSWIPGLLFIDGRLLGWPARSVSLRANAEGTFELVDPPTDVSGTIAADETTTFTLASINGPRTREGMVMIVGPVDRDGMARLGWSEGTIVIPLEPGPKNTFRERSFHTRGLAVDQREWIPQFPQPIESISLARDQWGIVVPPEWTEADRTKVLGAQSFVVDAPLALETELSLCTIELGPWFVRDGRAVGIKDPSPDVPRAFVGTDDARQRIWFANFGSESSGIAPAGAEIERRLRSAGATQIVELARGGMRLIPGEFDATLSQRRATLPSRLSILPVADAPRLGHGSGEPWERLRIATALASTSPQATNDARALFDGRSARDASLGHFWAAAPNDRSRTLWVEFRLQKATRVGAVDLLHAENCGFSPAFNLRAFRLLGRGNTAGQWTELLRVEHDSPVGRERLWIPESAGVLEELRLEILAPNFLTGGATARLAEVIVWGED